MSIARSTRFRVEVTSATSVPSAIAWPPVASVRFATACTDPELVAVR